MELWRRDGLPDHPRRSELLFAIREHDNGWRETDAAPRIHPETHWPLTFRDLAPKDRIELWQRGVRRFIEDSPFAALLILRHAVEIHQGYAPTDDWMAFRSELSSLQEELVESSEIDPAATQASYRFLELADTLSLGACGALEARDGPASAGGYRFEAELGKVRLAPFPLAGATTVEIAYRSLPRRGFDSARELAGAAAVATWKRLAVRIEPLDPI